jgi:hypothetical protein
LRSERSQSSHNVPKGRDSRTNTPAAFHQERCRIPKRANGNSDALTATNTAGQRKRTPSAIAIIAHITGLPVNSLTLVVGHATHRASSGHVHGAGRSR